MAAVQPNSIALNSSTKLPPPIHIRHFSRSRSPSRSPTRKARFAARELDPLLKNLSPDSTLEALQETNAITGNPAEKNAIARSISDASEPERKLGIRAAIAAKKLQEWTVEVKAWPWPSTQDRGWGAGFVAPVANRPDAPVYLGCLPQSDVEHHEERLDEIWDAIDTLGMDEIKDFVFSSHHPQTARQSAASSSYGRMRDFTALITATVVQSLPVLANLKNLLETWSIRLSVLRQVPLFLSELDQIKRGLAAISEILRDDARNCKLDKKELEVGKVMFGNKVSNLGKRIDSMLDLLEGQQDTLPRFWIDSLEDIENKYAEWVAKAEQIILRNQIAQQKTSSRPITPSAKSRTPTTSPSKVPLPASTNNSPVAKQEGGMRPSSSSSSSAPNVPSSPSRPPSVVKRKPLIEVNPKIELGHRRGKSDVSMAESTLSNYSLENAEIVDARATPLLPSHPVNVISNPLPGSVKVESPIADDTKSDEPTSPVSPVRPPIVHHASTASIELIPKDQIKQVMLRRSLSHDMLAGRKPSRGSELARSASIMASPSSREFDNKGPVAVIAPDIPKHSGVSPSSSLRVQPLRIRASISSEDNAPAIPRRSSKRLSMPIIDSLVPLSSSPNGEPSENVILETAATSTGPVTPPNKVARAETFDDKLKSILATMPTKFRLTELSDSSSSDASSASSSRDSSPVRPLKLSPVKDARTLHLNSTSGVRVYNLKGGKSRDAPPIKLFVRAVGENGERVMVRVGGGWADLAEYLREYSLHHGGRGLADQKLEVANYPGSQPPQVTVSGVSSLPISKEAKEVVDDPGFDFDLNNQSQKSAEDIELENSPWRPPPVPIVTPNYWLPIARTTSPDNNRAVRSSTPTPSSRPGSRLASNAVTTPVITKAAAPNGNYTPLGGAGPVSNNRRSASYTLARAPKNDGMTSQARAVSGSHASRHPLSNGTLTTTIGNRTIVQSPTTTVTTTITMSRSRTGRPSTRRVSSPSTTVSTTPAPQPNDTSIRPVVAKSPQGSQISNTSSGSGGTFVTARTTNTDTGSKMDRRGNRVSFADTGGVRRVFLRQTDGRGIN